MITYENSVQARLKRLSTQLPLNCDECLTCVAQYNMSDFELILRRFQRASSEHYQLFQKRITALLKATSITPSLDSYFRFESALAYINGRSPVIKTISGRLYFTTNIPTIDHLIADNTLNIDSEMAALNYEVIAYHHYFQDKKDNLPNGTITARRLQPYLDFNFGDYQKTFNPTPEHTSIIYNGLGKIPKDPNLSQANWRQQIIELHGSKSLWFFDNPPKMHLSNLPFIYT